MTTIKIIFISKSTLILNIAEGSGQLSNFEMGPLRILTFQNSRMHGLLQNALLEHHFYSLPLFPITLNMTSVAVPGEGPGGPAPPYFYTKLRPEGPKKKIGDPPSLSKGLDDRAPLIWRSGSATGHEKKNWLSNVYQFLKFSFTRRYKITKDLQGLNYSLLITKTEETYRPVPFKTIVSS